MNRSLFDEVMEDASAKPSIKPSASTCSAQIWCDGACSGNPGAGGWGAIIEMDDVRRELSGGSKHTTNNQMEMQALIHALKAVPDGTKVHIVTDSDYVVKGATQWIKGWMRNNWKTASKAPVKNQELWQEIHALLQSRPHTFQWVKGHAGHAENERCDELARTAIARFR